MHRLCPQKSVKNCFRPWTVFMHWSSVWLCTRDGRLKVGPLRDQCHHAQLFLSLDLWCEDLVSPPPPLNFYKKYSPRYQTFAAFPGNDGIRNFRSYELSRPPSKQAAVSFFEGNYYLNLWFHIKVKYIRVITDRPINPGMLTNIMGEFRPFQVVCFWLRPIGIGSGNTLQLLM